MTTKILCTETESTDVTAASLLINETQQIVPYSKETIVETIIQRTKLEEAEALIIADEVEAKLDKLGEDIVHDTLVSELINNQLRNMGIEQRKRDRSIKIPIELMHNIVSCSNNSNANVKPNPEAVNTTLAEFAFKRLMIDYDLPRDVARAHKEGSIYIHDLGMFPRVYCGSHSLAYLLKYGLHLHNVESQSDPAKSATVFVGHLGTWIATIQSYFAGALGFSYANIFFAPLLMHSTDKEIEQIAQMLTFKISQTAFSRGGQASFVDLNLHCVVPEELFHTPAVGKGGCYMYPVNEDGSYNNNYDPSNDENTAKRLVGEIIYDKEHIDGAIPISYGELERVAQKFMIQLLNMAAKGDARGMPFTFPKLICHIDDATFIRGKEVLTAIGKAVSSNGSPYIAYDRNGVSVSSCCRLKTELNEEMISTLKCAPESIRTVGVQNVSINLPHIALNTGNYDAFIDELDKAMSVSIKAHQFKRTYIQSILETGTTGILAQLTYTLDGKPYTMLEGSMASYLVGIVGLEECVKVLSGKSLVTEEGHDLGMRIIEYMSKFCDEKSETEGIKLVLEETPAESSSWSMCQLDRAQFGDRVDALVSAPGVNAMYTNSIHIPYELPTTISDRLQLQGDFSSLIKGGSIVHVWVGEARPDPKSVVAFIKLVKDKTKVEQFAISPDFTVCDDCGKVVTGKFDTCKSCGSDNVDYVTRVTGYFGRVSRWNQGKQKEFEIRKRISL